MQLEAMIILMSGSSGGSNDKSRPELLLMW